MSDHTDSIAIAAELDRAARTVEELADSVGEARQVMELASDRRKNSLAKHMKGYLDAEMSVAKAEWLARTSEYFLQEFEDQAEQVLIATKAIQKYDAAKVICEARRSLLSHSKTIRDELQG